MYDWSIPTILIKNEDYFVIVPTGVKILTALTAGGSKEAEMATPTSEPVLPPRIDKATPAPEGNAISTPTHRLRSMPLAISTFTQLLCLQL